MKTFVCKNCSKEQPRLRGSTGKFCNHSCQREFEYKTNVSLWLSGELVGWKGATRQLKAFVRKYLYETRGTACCKCGWDEKHPSDGYVLTEIDHIDGNAENCNPDNLRILCPNCHSMTDTFRRRNKESKRSRN